LSIKWSINVVIVGPGSLLVQGVFAHRTDPSPTGLCQLQQIPYRLRMISQFNLGGHFGCVHRVFVAETIGPILRDPPLT